MQTKDIKTGVEYVWEPQNYLWNGRTAKNADRDRYNRVTAIKPRHSETRVVVSRFKGHPDYEVEEKGVLVSGSGGKQFIVQSREIRMTWADWEIEKVQIQEALVARAKAIQDREDAAWQTNQAILEAWPAGVKMPREIEELERSRYSRTRSTITMDSADLLALLNLIPKTEEN